jgi:hypothetical protein
VVSRDVAFLQLKNQLAQLLRHAERYRLAILSEGAYRGPLVSQLNSREAEALRILAEEAADIAASDLGQTFLGKKNRPG